MFNADLKQILSMCRGSATDHWYYTHQYFDGELVMIKETARNSVCRFYIDDVAEQQLQQLEPLYNCEKNYFLHLVEKQRSPDTGELDVLKDIYQLFDHQYDNLISEYACGSPLWLLLESLDKSQYAGKIHAAPNASPCKTKLSIVWFRLRAQNILPNFLGFFIYLLLYLPSAW